MTDNRPFVDGNVGFATAVTNEFDDIKGGIIFNIIVNDLNDFYSHPEAGGEFAEDDYNKQGFFWAKGTASAKFSSDSTAENAGLNNTQDYIYFANTLDDCSGTNGSPPNTDIWDAATAVTASGEATVLYYDSGTKIRVWTGDGGNGTGSAMTEATGANATDYKTLTGDSCVYFKAAFGVSGGDTKLGKIQISDGGTATVDIYTKTTSTTTSFFKLVFDKSGETCDLYVDKTLVGENISLASLSKWYVKFSVYTSGNTNAQCQWDIDFLRHIHENATSTTYISDALQTTDTVYGATLFVPNSRLITLNNGTATYYLSGDGGANYQEATLGQQIKFDNAGTAIVMKIIGTSTTAVDGTTEQDPVLFPARWGVQFVEY